MTYIDSSTTTGGTSTASSTASSNQTNTGLNQLDNTQTFLNLLVAQLKNQDPDDPTDPTSFMTEIAQLTAVQSQTTLNADEETVAADSMLNNTVSGTGSDGQTVTGTVTGVLLSSSGDPQLEIGTNGTTLDLSAITAVYGAAATTGSSSTTSGSTGSDTSNTSDTSATTGTSTTATGTSTTTATAGTTPSTSSSSATDGTGTTSTD